MADQNSNPNESGVKDNATDQNTSDEALLFDEATVLSREEESGQEADDSIDTSEIMGNSQESGNENIQTVVPETVEGERSGYAEGFIEQDELSEQAGQEDTESVAAARDDLEPSDGAQLNVSELNTPLRDTQSQPQTITPESPDGTSDAAVDDFVTPADSVQAASVPELQDGDDTTEPQPEPEPEPQPEPEPEPEPESEPVSIDATITIDTIAGDDILNAEEADEEFTTITGTVGGDVQAGDEVTLTVNGNTYTGPVVDDGNGNLTYSIDVLTDDLEADNSIDASVTTSDAAGNEATATADRDISVDTEINAEITIDTIAGDDILNAEEVDQTNTTVTGTVGGDVQAGDEVTLTVNGNSYTGDVVDDGNGNLTYSIDVLTNDLEADNSIDASVTASDAAGNTATATADRDISVDTEINAEITIDEITGDDILNAEEVDQTNTTITGTVGGDVQAGDTVTLIVNGNTYTGTVTGSPGNLVYSIDVKTNDLIADNSIDASVTASDAAGNTATATADRDISVDTEINAEITIDTIAGNDIIDAGEGAKEFTTITGTVGGDVVARDEVTLTVNGNSYTGPVVDDGNGNLTYSINVLTDDLEADNSIDASVTTTDEAGNTATADNSRTISLDGTGFGGAKKVVEGSGDDALSGNVFASDNHFGENPQIDSFNYTDNSGTTQTADAGSKVTTLHGGELTVNSDGSWSYTPPVSGDHSDETLDDVLAGAGFEYTASIDGGNTYTAAQTISVLDAEPTAKEDTDTVTLDDDLNGSTTGNVMTGTGGHSEAELQADNEGPDTSKVTEVRFGDTTTVRFDNSDDVKTDDDGNQYVEIAGDNGLLKLYQDGSYEYEVTEPTTTKTVDDGNWDTVTLKAFDFGTEYKDSNGKLDLSKADGTVSDANNDIGVEGTLNGQVSKQINHNYDHDPASGSTGESEALAVQFDNPITKATVSLSNLYKNDNGGEAGDVENGRWEAFDAEGDLVGYGVLDVNYTNGHQGEADIDLSAFDGGSFSTLVFSATAYDNPAINTDDSSDYFIQSIRYEEVNTAADQFTYQITDTDGDESETTLTIDMTPPQAETVSLPDLLDVSITIDPITGDDLLNTKEAQEETTTITGTVGGDASEGDTVTLTVNGNPYTGSVTENKTYSIDVNTPDLQADNEVDASISIKNDAGLTATAKADRDISLEGDTDGFSFKVFAADAKGEILLDNDGNPIDATTISEPGTANGQDTTHYIVKAVDGDGIPLDEQPDGNIKVVFENNSAENEDYATAQGDSDFGQGAGTKTVAVNEKFSATAEDDELADNGETFTVSLDDGSYSEDAANTADGSGRYETVTYDDATVTTTILDETDNDPANRGDNDSAFTLKLFASDEKGDVLLDSSGDPITATEIHEDGETSAFYVVKAAGADGKPLPEEDQPTGDVKVSFNNGTADNNDYSVKGVEGTSVTLGEAFSAQADNDTWADNNETFTVELVENSYSEDAAYETVDYDDASVTTTIRDLDIKGVEDNKNTQEGEGAGGDWEIPILQNLGDIHSSDEFDSIKISVVPEGATLKNGDVKLEPGEDGTYTIAGQNASSLTITPAVDSSKDITLDYELSLEGDSVASFTQSIVIKPDADEPWTLSKLESESATFEKTLLEDDGWQSLGDQWFLEGDSSKSVSLTASTGEPEGGDGSESIQKLRFSELPEGTVLRYGSDGDFKTSNSDQFDVPFNQLGTLQIKTPDNVNGDLSFKVKAKAVDQDEDTDDNRRDGAWGKEDTLTIKVSGDADLSADLVSVSAQSIIAEEDTGRDPDTGEIPDSPTGGIPLNITFEPDEYTGTEVIELEIKGLKDDAFIVDSDGNILNAGENNEWDGSSITLVLDPSGENETVDGDKIYNAEAADHIATDAGAFADYISGLTLIPPHDSNEDFTLTINQKATEPNYDKGVGGEQTQQGVTDTFKVQLTSKVDTPVVTGTDTPITLTEGGNWQTLSDGDGSSFQIASGEDQHLSEEVYALIRNVPNDVGLRIVDGNGNELFDQLVLANVGSDDSTDWRIDNDTLQKINDGDYRIQLKTPDADYSGFIDFNIRVTVLDIDSDDGQETDTLVSDHTMNIVVQPEVEDYDNSQSSGNEDEWIELGLSIGSNDGDVLVEDEYNYNNQSYDLKIEIPDLGQTAEDIQVQGNNLAIDYVNNLVYLNQEDLASVKVLAPQHSNEDLSGIQFHRFLKDDMDDDSTSDVDIQEVVTGHTVNVIGVADGWEDVDHAGNGTTDDTEGSGYDGFIVQDIAGGAVDDGKDISHVLIKFKDDGATYKIDDYGNIEKTTDYGHPQIFFDGLKQEYGEVEFYLIKAGSVNQADGGYFDPFTGQNVKPEDYSLTTASNEITTIPSSHLQESGSGSGMASDNTITPLTDIIVRNDNIEDHYHENNDTDPSYDTSESEYYIIRDKSEGLGSPNTTWMVEGGINAGGGVWVVPADALNSANIKILQPNAGDGSLDLEIVPVSKENDGDIKFDQAHRFTINYGDGGDEEIASIGDNGSLVVSGSNGPSIDSLFESKDGTEDNNFDDILSGISSGATLSYVVKDTDDVSIINTDNLYKLPEELGGGWVVANAEDLDLKPDTNFSGEAGFGVNVIATDGNGNQSFVSQDITLNIDPVLDVSSVSAEGGTETDDAASSESIALNLQISSSDTDGSEALQGGITITPLDGGALTGTGVTDNGDGSYTVSSDDLSSVEFVPDTYSHGTYNFKISYTWADSDANGDTDDTEVIDSSFSIDLASQVDQIDVDLTPTADIDETEDYPLDLSVVQHDDDGSEIASVKISGIPDALVIHDASGNKIGNYSASDNNDGTVTIVLKGSEVPADGGLTLHDTTGTYGGSFTADVTAFSFDKVTKEITNDSKSVELTINPVASAVAVDAGSAEEDNVQGSEDNAGMPLDLDVIMTDLDGSERLKVTFDDVDLSEGQPTFRYTDSGGNTQPLTDDSLLTSEEAKTIEMIPPENYSGTFDLKINVQTVEVELEAGVDEEGNPIVKLDSNGNPIVKLDAENNPIGPSAEFSDTVHVTVNPEADSVTFDNSGNTTNDAGAIVKTVSEDAASVDVGLNLDLTDSSELLNLVIEGLEPGSVVSVTGQDLTVGNSGSVDFTGLTEAEAESLSVQPPENYSGTMNIDINVKTVDGDDILDTAVTQSFNLEVTPEADQPGLDDPVLGDAIENDNGTYTYDLDLSASLTDDSEELSLRVDGIPEGSSLTNDDGDSLTITDGSITLTPDQLAGLQLTSPEQLVSDGDDGLHIEATAISTEDMDTPDTSDDVSAIQTKTIIDGVIEGIAYTTSSGLSGLTDQHGGFQYREGDSVTFKVGDVVLGTATPDDLDQSNIFLQDLANVDRSDMNDEYVENMAVFLQSLDQDGNADNGITLTDQVHSSYEGVSFNLSTASESEVQDLVAQAGKTAISEEQAMDHVQRMLADYAGQTDFDERIDDSVNTASFAHAPVSGLQYETSSGLTGTLNEGQFNYQSGDTVDLYADGQLVASFGADDIGTDQLITFDEAGFSLSLEDVQQLLQDEASDATAEDSDAGSPVTEDADNVASTEETNDIPNPSDEVAESESVVSAETVPTGAETDDSGSTDTTDETDNAPASADEVAESESVVLAEASQEESATQSEPELKTARIEPGISEGLAYTTDSGLDGEVLEGSFDYYNGDTISLFAGDQLVAVISADDIADDGSIRVDQIDFLVGSEALEVLLAGDAAEPTPEPEVTEEPEAAESTPEPEVTEEPESAEETAGPEVTEEPETADATLEPEVTEEPEVAEETAEPEVTEEPETADATLEPEVTEEPEVAEETAEPEVTEEPETAEETPEPIAADSEASETVVLTQNAPKAFVRGDDQNDFGIPEEGDEFMLSAEDDLFNFGEQAEVQTLDSIQQEVAASNQAQDWLTQTEQAADDNAPESFGDFSDTSSTDETGYLSDDEQPCEW